MSTEVNQKATQEKKRDPNNPCLFCKDPRGVSLERELAYSARDSYAVSPGHTLVIPKRHVASFFDLTPEEIQETFELLKIAKVALDSELRPEGYNVGWNSGHVAGQHIFHAHMHVFPRFKGEQHEGRGIRSFFKS